ncbi:hypothetical protein ABEF92_000416 [Exophiala dermatitidis]|uniref:MFS transporter, FHS family, L-fucose permease n=2 Tax=Exophiala dermatitidis TaxID=5970 RepID=H6BV38_EXODN|nr:MFS transporter, FHS family, L-fucose permease [Exophiala dermatitidis NIH/UT8656]KAJ4535372.1 hypothetical protein HRR77_007990 [Exophiala dermatitidis]EHY55821.1 MFS transporter, FHS family, L-fucose permease [Exophiala dermatitidis NIH/UT8656]KAJ4556991.1 hypothetical protein HRR79_008796 [Exophiala dermatitidis]KAJ4568696.1 hypothetical protein HRR82_007931 [Exophiala dermatitidis]KAJ4606302.1 hypothetical protein HRR85_007668 [Exophiala dermatitidis]
MQRTSSMVPDRGPATSAVTIAITVLATVFVAARFYTRVWLVRSIKQDDWWILAAWILAVGFSTSICIAVKYGLGKHKADIPDSSFTTLRKAEYGFSILYNPALMLTKTSIVVFYLSVMSKDVDPVFKWCNWLTLALVNLVGAALTFYNIFQCRPIAAGYQYPTPNHAKCTDIVTLYLSSAPINIITDIAILFLPMPILTRMRLPRKQKVILVVTFSFGAFVAVVDVIRIAYLQNAALNRFKASGTRLVEQNDFSWYASLSFMWSAVEVCIGIICACVPSLKPLFLRFLPSFIRDPGDTLTPTNGSIDHGMSIARSPTINSVHQGSISILTNPAAFRQPSVQEYCGDDDGDQMGFLNMLAAPPGRDDGLSLARTSTRLTRRSTARTTTSDFGFVKMSRSKNMLRLTNLQSIWPNAVVTVVFFLWGFAYGLLDTLNSKFQTVAGLSTGEVLGLHAAYYAGYAVGPLTLGVFIIKRYGFKAAMISGLCVYGCGTLVFWPSAVLTSYGAFIVSNFIVGFGLSCLEIAANPYIALCGPLEYAEVRLNVSQAFQAIGTVCSPLLATKVLFKRVLKAQSLVDVQWTYLGIAIFVFALAVLFYYIPLPEATDEQLEEQAEKRSSAYCATPYGRWKVVYITLGLGVFSQWCYVGLQECVGSYLQPLISLLIPGSSLSPFDFLTLGHTVFSFGRFLTALLNYMFKPRWVLLLLYAGLIVCLALNMNLNGDAGAALGVLTFVFEAGIFSNIYAIAMRGLGVHTKTGSALMAAAISGGAVFPPIQWGVSNARGLRYSYCVPLAVAAFGMLFPIYLNLVAEARVQVDPVYGNHTHSQKRKILQGFTSDPAPSYDDAKGMKSPTTHAGDGSARKERITKRTQAATPTPSVEHVEQRLAKSRSRNGAPAPSSPILTKDFAGEREMSKERQCPTKYAGEDLTSWTAEDSSDSSGDGDGSGSGNDNESNNNQQQTMTKFDDVGTDERTVSDTDMSTRHRHPSGPDGPALKREFDRDDDYHAIMRKI